MCKTQQFLGKRHHTLSLLLSSERQINLFKFSQLVNTTSWAPRHHPTHLPACEVPKESQSICSNGDQPSYSKNQQVQLLQHSFTLSVAANKWLHVDSWEGAFGKTFSFLTSGSHHQELFLWAWPTYVWPLQTSLFLPVHSIQMPLPSPMLWLIHQACALL